MEELIKQRMLLKANLKLGGIKGEVLPLAALLVLGVVFTGLNTNFISSVNFLNLLREMSLLLIIALAGSLVIMIGSIDLSVGAIVTLSGTIAAFSVPFFGAGAVAVGMLVGMLAGAVNGLVFTWFRIPSFLVTLGMLSSLTGLANYLSQGRPILFNSPAFEYVARGTPIMGIPNIFLWSVACLVLVILVCFWTVFGRNIFAVGGGEKVAELSGIKVKNLKIKVFMISGLLCGLAGALLASRIGAGTPRMGDPFLLDSIAAVVMGGTALSGGIGGPHRTVIGVMVITVLSNGMNITGVHPFLQEIIKGIVVISAVAATIDRSKFDLAK